MGKQSGLTQSEVRLAKRAKPVSQKRINIFLNVMVEQTKDGPIFLDAHPINSGISVPPVKDQKFFDSFEHGNTGRSDSVISRNGHSFEFLS